MPVTSAAGANQETTLPSRVGLWHFSSLFSSEEDSDSEQDHLPVVLGAVKKNLGTTGHGRNNMNGIK